jgi:hypothetical protein
MLSSECVTRDVPLVAKNVVVIAVEHGASDYAARVLVRASKPR